MQSLDLTNDWNEIFKGADSFPDFHSFHEKFLKFQDVTRTKFKIQKSNSVESINRRKGRTISLAMKYVGVRYDCTSTSLTNVRKMNDNEKSKSDRVTCCPVMVYLRYCSQSNCLRIRDIYMKHNHGIHCSQPSSNTNNTHSKELEANTKKKNVLVIESIKTENNLDTESRNDTVPIKIEPTSPSTFQTEDSTNTDSALNKSVTNNLSDTDIMNTKVLGTSASLNSDSTPGFGVKLEEAETKNRNGKNRRKMKTNVFNYPNLNPPEESLKTSNRLPKCLDIPKCISSIPCIGTSVTEGVLNGPQNKKRRVEVEAKGNRTLTSTSIGSSNRALKALSNNHVLKQNSGRKATVQLMKKSNLIDLPKRLTKLTTNKVVSQGVRKNPEASKSTTTNSTLCTRSKKSMGGDCNNVPVIQSVITPSPKDKDEYYLCDLMDRLMACLILNDEGDDVYRERVGQLETLLAYWKDGSKIIIDVIPKLVEQIDLQLDRPLDLSMSVQGMASQMNVDEEHSLNDSLGEFEAF